MEDRIEINGVWYVREDLADKSTDIVEDLTHSEHYVFESKDYTFDVVRIYKNTNEFYPGFEIRLTKKKNDEYDVWDHEPFFIGILDENPDTLRLAAEDLNPQGIKDLTNILRFLKNQKWL